MAARTFPALHGPCVSALGFAVDDPPPPSPRRSRRGARPFERERGELRRAGRLRHRRQPRLLRRGARGASTARAAGARSPDVGAAKGFVAVDHLTNNVHAGTMTRWSDFYKHVFGFTEVRSFDIEGKKTRALLVRPPFALRDVLHPDQRGQGETGQIAEYLREYRGPGVQHIALLTRESARVARRHPRRAARRSTSTRTTTRRSSVACRACARARERIRAPQRPRRRRRERVPPADFTQNLIGPMFFEFIQREEPRCRSGKGTSPRSSGRSSAIRRGAGSFEDAPRRRRRLVAQR